MTDRNLLCLVAMREARTKFFGMVEAHAVAYRIENSMPEIAPEQRRILRSDTVAQIAEFYYILQSAHISGDKALRGFLERHNQDMRDLLGSCVRGRARNGLAEERIKAALFSDKQINYVVHESQQGGPRFDQQSLARIFIQSMSRETCRTTLVFLSECGFFDRHEFNQVLIVSKGVLEQLYSEYLAVIVERVVQNA
ncbi:MAG: hypothetical protein WBC68_11595 [Albidovulum sp.]